jgi:hypothetical protein
LSGSILAFYRFLLSFWDLADFCTTSRQLLTRRAGVNLEVAQREFNDAVEASLAKVQRDDAEAKQNLSLYTVNGFGLLHPETPNAKAHCPKDLSVTSEGLEIRGLTARMISS